MSGHITSAVGSRPTVQSEYAHFCQWLAKYFADHPGPEGVHAIRVFNSAFRAGFTQAGKYLLQAAKDGTLKKLRFNRFLLNTRFPGNENGI